MPPPLPPHIGLELEWFERHPRQRGDPDDVLGLVLLILFGGTIHDTALTEF